MTVRPCDQCGGSGEVWVDETGDDAESVVRLAQPCPRCVEDMPRLHWKHAPRGMWDQFRLSIPRGFTPDPDTVMRWCLTHDTPWVAIHHEIEGCYVKLLLYSQDEETKQPCRFVWVPAITEADRLEVTE